jgi:gamma-glutamyltranspeptidase/glutathione hydrolase
MARYGQLVVVFHWLSQQTCRPTTPWAASRGAESCSAPAQRGRAGTRSATDVKAPDFIPTVECGPGGSPADPLGNTAAMTRGVVAAGHPLTAEAGASALRAGGNAVDAALAAMCASFVCEPLLTGLGAGGYMLVGAPDGDDVLLDFFVEAPGRGGDPPRRVELVPVSVVFGDVVQVFHVGAASVGTYGCPAGICAAHARFASLPLAELVAPAVRLAREGVPLNAHQTYILELLWPIIASSPEAHALFAKASSREGEVLRLPDVADGLERLAADGAAPFYTGEIATAVCDWVSERGGMLAPADLAAYQAVAREPIEVSYRGLCVRTNPPPSAGGILIAAVLAELDREPALPSRERLVAAMIDAQRARTAAFMESLHLQGLNLRGFQEEFLGARRGNTTHISAIDEDGWACTATVSNGSCSGVVVPGTGLHLNNMLGEADLNPLGVPLHPPGRRLPSMMAPTLVRRADGAVELALGSAGSNRIRSAILQVICNVVDRGMGLAEAVQAPRLHWEDGVLYVEPGAEPTDLEGIAIARFNGPNVFFGGCQAVRRDPDSGRMVGAGDPRRGGAVIAV